jgi:hypothetical protein
VADRALTMTARSADGGYVVGALSLTAIAARIQAATPLQDTYVLVVDRQDRTILAAMRPGPGAPALSAGTLQSGLKSEADLPGSE